MTTAIIWVWIDRFTFIMFCNKVFNISFSANLPSIFHCLLVCVYLHLLNFWLGLHDLHELEIVYVCHKFCVQDCLVLHWAWSRLILLFLMLLM